MTFPKRFDVDFRNETIRCQEPDAWTAATLTWSGKVPRLDATSLLLEFRPDDPFPIRAGTGTAMAPSRRLEVLEAMIQELLDRHAAELLVEVYRDPEAAAIESLVERLREVEGLRVHASSMPNRVDLHRKWPGQPRLVRGNRLRFGKVEEDVVRDLLELTSSEPNGALRLEYGEDDFIEASPRPDAGADRFNLEWRLLGAADVSTAGEPLTLDQTVARFLDFHAKRHD